MSQDTVRVIARLRAKPGREAELRSLAARLIAPTRKEAGCVRYELLENEADPAELTFVEEWRDSDSLNAHLATAHVQYAVSQGPELLLGEMDLRRFKLVGQPMDKWRSILGLVTGVLLALSAGAHSLTGWNELKFELERVQAPGDLVRAVAAGWNFGGAAMLAFGLIVVALFARRLQGSAVSLFPAIVIGATYVAFGVGAMLVNAFDPFFLVFVIPGVLLLIASVGRRNTAPTIRGPGPVSGARTPA